MNPGLGDNMESAIVVEGNDLISPKLFRCNIATILNHLMSKAMMKTSLR